jgi:hypothetical protein
MKSAHAGHPSSHKPLRPWSPLGLRVTATGSAISASHAMLPTPVLLADRIRVYFATCDEDLRGRILFADLERTPPFRVMSVEERPVMDVGPAGSFDCDGVNPSQVLEVNGRLFLVYIGWQRDVEGAPYTLLGGLAESLDGGRTFARLRAPLLARTEAEKFFRTAPFLSRRPGGGWQMLYIGGSQFAEAGGRNQPIYSLKRLVSDRPDTWFGEPDELLAPDPDAGVIGFGRPVLWPEADGTEILLISERTAAGYEMLQSPLHAVEGGAAAFDPVLDGARAPWEDQMTCFGAPLRVNGVELLFYNGNQFGRSGFGLAQRQGLVSLDEGRAS